jgi:hypothetical protein
MTLGGHRTPSKLPFMALKTPSLLPGALLPAILPLTEQFGQKPGTRGGFSDCGSRSRTAVAYTGRIADQAAALAAIVADLPWSLTPHKGEPLIEALMRVETEPVIGQSVTARLLEVALDVHPDDPLLWASKFLRHLPQLRANRKSTLDARNSALAGVRQVRSAVAEATFDPMIETAREAIPPPPTLLSPELLESVLAYAERMIGSPLSAAVRGTLTETTCVALTMLDGHSTRARRSTESLRIMQAHVGGKREGRLGWQLGQSMDSGVARAAARLLVGWGGVQERGLLWHVAHGTDPATIPLSTLTKWRKDLSDLDPAVHDDPRGRSRTRDRIGRHAATARLAAPISTHAPAVVEQLTLLV